MNHTHFRKQLAAVAIVACMGATCILPAARPVECIRAAAETGEITDTSGITISYRTLDRNKDGIEDAVEITSCDKSITSANIPAVVQNLPVTSIGKEAFYYCRSLEEVSIPSTVTHVGESAFSGTPWLEARRAENPLVVVNLNILIDGYACVGDVTIPDGIVMISDGAFRYCNNLRSITIPDSVTSIGDNTFYSCMNLKEITISDGVTSIGNYACNSCTSLTGITIPGSVTSIGVCAFEKCSALTDVTMLDGVTCIGSCAFKGCTSLTELSIPESVTQIDGNAFATTPWLEARQAEQPLVTVNHILIDGRACVGSVLLPEDVTSIANSAFYSNDALTGITIPDSVTRIGDFSFTYCTNLTDMTVLNPDCVFSEYGFSDCPSLTIHGYTNSTAQSFAEQHQYAFVALDGGELPSETSPTESVPEATPGEDMLYGDADGNGTVDVVDVIAINKYILGKEDLTDAGFAAADTDKSGVIEPQDALNILKLVIRMLSPSDFPVQKN